MPAPHVCMSVQLRRVVLLYIVEVGYHLYIRAFWQRIFQRIRRSCKHNVLPPCKRSEFGLLNVMTSSINRASVYMAAAAAPLRGHWWSAMDALREDRGTSSGSSQEYRWGSAFLTGIESQVFLPMITAFCALSFRSTRRKKTNEQRKTQERAESGGMVTTVSQIHSRREKGRGEGREEVVNPSHNS